MIVLYSSLFPSKVHVKRISSVRMIKPIPSPSLISLSSSKTSSIHLILIIRSRWRPTHVSQPPFQNRVVRRRSRCIHRCSRQIISSHPCHCCWTLTLPKVCLPLLSSSYSSLGLVVASTSCHICLACLKLRPSWDFLFHHRGWRKCVS